MVLKSVDSSDPDLYIQSAISNPETCLPVESGEYGSTCVKGVVGVVGIRDIGTACCAITIPCCVGGTIGVFMVRVVGVFN